MSDSLTTFELWDILFALDRGISPMLTKNQAYALAARLREATADERVNTLENEADELRQRCAGAESDNDRYLRMLGLIATECNKDDKAEACKATLGIIEAVEVM